jgi:hypothetical protein
MLHLAAHAGSTCGGGALLLIHRQSSAMKDGVPACFMTINMHGHNMGPLHPAPSAARVLKPCRCCRLMGLCHHAYPRQLRSTCWVLQCPQAGGMLRSLTAVPLVHRGHLLLVSGRCEALHPAFSSSHTASSAGEVCTLRIQADGQQRYIQQTPRLARWTHTSPPSV